MIVQLNFLNCWQKIIPSNIFILTSTTSLKLVQKSFYFLPKHSSANYLRGATVAAMIDELPMLAVLGTQVAGGLTIRDAQELRVKESDRIVATVANLRALGAEVEEYADGLCVKGPVRLQGATLPSFGDHRIAMAFGVAGLIATGTTEILNAECAGVSFPEFFALLDGLAER